MFVCVSGIKNAVNLLIKCMMYYFYYVQSLDSGALL